MDKFKFSEFCANCRQSLAQIEKVLFVEKEIGRCFCSEECIYSYFEPAVREMVEDLKTLRSNADFKPEEFEQYGQYRILTLEDPDEVWVESKDSGEKIYRFIAAFRHGEDRFSYVVTCLTIEREPSFVFLHFPTRDEDLVDQYRRGQEIRFFKESQAAQQQLEDHGLPEVHDGEPDADDEVEAAETSAIDDSDIAIDADSGGSSFNNPHPKKLPKAEDLLETLYHHHKIVDDIPIENFPQFQPFVEPTIDDADEIWQYSDKGSSENWLIFIKFYDSDSMDKSLSFYMIAVTRHLLDPETKQKKLETLFAFPTTDIGLVQVFRKGMNSLNKAFRVGWVRGRAA